MLTTAETDLPTNLKQRLKEEAAFTETFNAYTTENLIGFRQPLAVATAVIGPVLIAFIYYISDFTNMLQVAFTFVLSSILFLLGGWYVNRGQIRNMYIHKTRARREAKADLRAGMVESTKLRLQSVPLFYEYEFGVVVLADTNDDRTVYFDVSSLAEDPRWLLYLNGDMHRSQWQWLKLRGSGGIADFSASGQRLTSVGEMPYVEAPDAWEAISIALNEPQDGDVLDMRLEDVKAIISRLI